MKLRHATGEFALDHCLVMGIVNLTPDSFFDGGRIDLGESIAYSLDLVAQGVDLLDVGAVKAGPGEDVDEETEIERLLPLVEALVDATDVPVSVDTSRARVATLALQAGASVVNDVTELMDADLARVAADAGAALVLMHNGGQVRGRPRHPRYKDVVQSVTNRWDELVERATSAGVREDAMLVDPGLDFGKTTFHSLELMRRLDELVAYGLPVLVAPSRKDVIGETLDLPPEDRLEGTLALVALAVRAGVHAVRVHDVAATVRTVRMVEAVLERRSPSSPLRGLWE